MGSNQVKAKKINVEQQSIAIKNTEPITNTALDVIVEESDDHSDAETSVKAETNNEENVKNNEDSVVPPLVLSLDKDVEPYDNVALNNQGKDEPNEVPPALPGYRPPAPQELTIDDIRPPIPWYEDDVEKDEFDWTEVEEDMQQYDEDRTVSSFPSSYATPGTSITPRSVLINSPFVSGPLSSRPLISPSGRKVSFMHQERTRNFVRRGGSAVSVDAVSIHGIPRRHHPRKGSLNFAVIDNHVRKTTPEHSKTFSALVDFLRQPIRFHPLSDIMMARAAIVWLAYQNIKSALLVHPTISTPKGLIKLLAQGNISYSEAYVVLCREAGLQAVLIDGIAKESDMDMVDIRSQVAPDSWVAVNVEADWQIVHPYWICKRLDGLGWSFDDLIRREEEQSGRKRSEIVQQLKTVLKTFINEDYFMPTPEVFVHSNWPEEPRWQLLRPQHTVQTREEFYALPILSPAFFRYGLRLVSERSCVLESVLGKVKIWIAADFNNAHRLTLSAELFLLETPFSNAKCILPDLPRMMIQSRHNEFFYFEIRFPIEGAFRLEISGGYHKSHRLRLCQFKLICNERMRNFKFTPYFAEPLMWGPGPECFDNGLVLPSKPTGIVKVYQQVIAPDPHNPTPLDRPPMYKQKQFLFHLHVDKSKMIDYITEVHGFLPDDNSREVTPLDATGQLLLKKKHQSAKKSNVSPEKQDYSDFAECYRDTRRRQLVLNIQIPHPGEFALVISAVPYTIDEDGQTKIFGEPVKVCVYMLRTVDDSLRENVHQKLARAELQTTMQGKNPTAVYNALEKCHRVKIHRHDDELAAGRNRAAFLSLRKEIFDAIHRRNYRVCNETLMKTSRYRDKGALIVETRRLFAVRKQLKLLLQFPKYVPELRHAGDELIYVHDPQPEVHITMGALFLLLEEPDRAIESWDYIVKHLSNDHVYKKMYLIAELFPSKNTRTKILTLLAEYDYERVKRVSAAASKFYIWTQKVIGVLEDMDFTIDEDAAKKLSEDAALRKEKEENQVHLTLAKDANQLHKTPANDDKHLQTTKKVQIITEEDL
ncbi:uncharacterized protein LOC128226730 isoform X1 [Mya arenaria]|uniref:uncharacterized protein LOC128226730 isoform X1 n=1 Tax=Mya arenaria TaxID=6604 RepID=UPI0022E5CF80|nr:uncharacterized protein LOC128226730 isoform X1 [Mya arenaria]XP_052792691.1 uncharacterized protein LOC128226730 isoform X1 [Mya arenaria]